MLFIECVWEAGNPGLLGRLAPNLVEKVLEADKGETLILVLFLLIITNGRTCSNAGCTEFKDLGYNIETLANGAVQMDNSCNPQACPSKELTKANMKIV